MNPAAPDRRILQPLPVRTITHGRPGTYAKGCRCRTEDGLFEPPQTTGCTEAWREYKQARRKKFGSTRVNRGAKYLPENER